jgi:hypothetical protein
MQNEGARVVSLPGHRFVQAGWTNSRPIKMDGHRRSRPSLAQVFPGRGPAGGLDHSGAPVREWAMRPKIADGPHSL